MVLGLGEQVLALRRTQFEPVKVQGQSTYWSGPFPCPLASDYAHLLGISSGDGSITHEPAGYGRNIPVLHQCTRDGHRHQPTVRVWLGVRCKLHPP